MVVLVFLTGSLVVPMFLPLSGGGSTVPSGRGLGSAWRTPLLTPEVPATSIAAPSLSVLATIPVGSEPIAAAYDSANGDVYVADYNSTNVSVVSGTSLANTVPVGTAPNAVAYDSANGDVYVVNVDSLDVSVLSGTSLVGTVAVGYDPVSATFDASNGYVYVVNAGSSNVSVLSGASLAGSVGVGLDPSSATVDAANGDVYVTNYGSNTVTVISGTSVVGTVPVGTQPVAAAYDGANSDVYVANEGSSNVSVLSGASIVGTVAVGSLPISVTFDSANGYLYVVNQGSSSDNVSVLSGTSAVASVLVGSTPSSATFVSANGYLYVTDSGSDEVSVVSGTSVVGTAAVGSAPGSATYDSANGYVYVTNYGSDNVSVLAAQPAPQYAVTFTTNPATCGTITFAGTTYSNGQSAQVPAGTYPLSAQACAGYNLQSLTGTGSVSVSGSTATVSGAGGISATFTVGTPPRYTVSFSTTPASCGSITFNGTVYLDGGSVSVTAGAYSVAATACSGYSLQNLTGTGSVSVAGSTATVSGTGGVQATFSAIPPSKYTVSFATVPSTCGSITFNGTTYSNAGSVRVYAGAYAVSARACTGRTLQSLTGSGSVLIIGSVANVSGAGGITATFVLSSSPKYTVTFATNPATCGSITFNGTVYVNGSSVQAYGGSYAISAQACTGDTLYNLTGSGGVSVSGPTATVSSAGGVLATFVPTPPTTYAVTFSTSPASCGSVTLNGTSYVNGGSVDLPAGTYAVSAQACAGDSLQSLVGSGSVAVSSGTATVSGAGGILATFVSNAPPKYAITFTTSPSACGSIAFNGTSFSNGQTLQSSAGTYPVSASACVGYSLASLTGSGQVSVSGANATVGGAGGIVATFVPRVAAPTSSTAGPGLFGLPGEDGYYLLGGIVLVLVVAIALVLRTRRRKEAPPAATAPTVRGGAPPGAPPN